MSALLPLLGIVALVVAVVAFIGTGVFIGVCMLIARFTDSRSESGSDAGRGYRDSPRATAPARRGGW